ncbi:rhoptry protein rop6 [Cystoisospora suis]|uniref:Rhoptry protein rop6 n=1 Tax=Cystoisospora suis TaxID=483139 RepID=A0A2C6KIZ3_9APIC|nr:rhoptry protein rop6 [Cystoisospora suis]
MKQQTRPAPLQLALFSSVVVAGLAVIAASEAFTLDGFSDDADISSLNEISASELSSGLNSHPAESHLSDVKLSADGQQRLRDQLQAELGWAADLSLLQQNHGIHNAAEENSLKRGLPGFTSEDTEDSVEEDDDSEDELSFAEVGDGADNAADDDFDEGRVPEEAFDPEESEDLEDIDSEAAFLEAGENEDLDDDGFEDETDSSVEDDTDEVTDNVLPDPYSATELSYLEQERPDENDTASLPASFAEIQSAKRSIRKHSYAPNQRASVAEIPASFNQDRVRVVSDQGPIENQLLDEAAPDAEGAGVVSPTGDEGAEGSASESEAFGSATEGAGEGTPSTSEGEDGSTEAEAGGATTQPAESVQEGAVEQEGKVAETPAPAELPSAEASAPGEGEALSPAAAGETEEVAAAEVADEMKNQDETVKEAKPQEVLHRHGWQDMETTQGLRKEEVGVKSSAPATTGFTALVVAISIAASSLLL